VNRTAAAAAAPVAIVSTALLCFAASDAAAAEAELMQFMGAGWPTDRPTDRPAGWQQSGPSQLKQSTSFVADTQRILAPFQTHHPAMAL